MPAIVLMLVVHIGSRAGEPVNPAGSGSSTHRELAPGRSSPALLTTDQQQVTQSVAGREARDRANRLLKSGEFQQFARYVERVAPQHPHDVDLAIAHCEALLAQGHSSAAEKAARAAWRHCSEVQADSAQRAAKLWLTARLRQGKSLEGLVQQTNDPRTLACLPPELVYWRQHLAGEGTYQVADNSVSARDPGGRFGLLLGADSASSIAIEVNGVQLSGVSLDTGAQYTMLSPAAAKSLSVPVGPQGTELVGFGKFHARPALIPTLRLGDIVIHNVPVLVGEAPGLGGAGGVQAAIGIDFMHHVRFTLDYHGSRVYAAVACDDVVPDRGHADWRFEVWTFAKACLAQAQAPQGLRARVLVDTGNRQGTYVSRAWFRRFDDRASSAARLVSFAYARGIPTLDLGGHTLPRWPAARRLPHALEQLGLFDILLGEDVLKSYIVTIDLRNRAIELRAAGAQTVE